ncbi:50S ribosomal protein L10 [Candidatus Parcubacteria bacterium 4484_255]|nr:MAG: 50S ribosomal protein L10 [Candidatus Parcubacteria bacterium 4484_255]
MAKTHQQKEEIINKLEKDLKGVKSLVFVDYYGLNVGEIEQLKKKLKEKSCKYIVAKKTLFNIVLKKIGLGHIDLTKIIGGLGLAYSLENEIMPIKVVFDFAKKNKDFNVRGGVLGKDFLDAEQTKALSLLPTRQELITKLLRAINAPISNFTYVLKGNLKGLVCILSNINY